MSNKTDKQNKILNETLQAIDKIIEQDVMANCCHLNANERRHLYSNALMSIRKLIKECIVDD